MYINSPVEDWGTELLAADFPNLRLTMCGYFGTALSLLYPEDVVDSVVDFLLGQFAEYVFKSYHFRTFRGTLIYLWPKIQVRIYEKKVTNFYDF